MKLFKKIPMIFDAKSYEVRVLYDENTINIVAFCDNHPANGFRHQVKISKKMDIERILDTPAVDALVQVCKTDIIEKRWERFLKEVAQ
jgi:hypothetical protein